MIFLAMFGTAEDSLNTREQARNLKQRNHVCVGVGGGGIGTKIQISVFLFQKNTEGK